MAISKVDFILYYSMFLFCTMQLSSLMGADVIANAPTPPTIPDAPAVWDYLLYPVANLGYFFNLMFTNSYFALFGSMILTPFAIAMIWAVLELLRGV